MADDVLALTEMSDPPPALPASSRLASSPALEDLYRDRYASMVRLAHLLTGSNEVAEDVVQESFVRVARRWGRAENPAAYLRAVVVNRCRSWQRRQVLERRHEGGAAAVDALPPELDETLTVLARLPSRQRAALVLRFYADLSEADIAEALGCRRGTVKSLIHRGLAQLKGTIQR